MQEKRSASTVTYDDLKGALEREALAATPAECHGLLCGLLCAPEDTGEAIGFREICEDVEERPQLLRVLRETREEAVHQLFGGAFEFTPLLPPDDEALGLRSRALGRWCEGFLLGLTLGGLQDWVGLSEDAREIVADLSEFTRIEPEPRATETAEAAYAELVEYVRAGVQLLSEELHPFTFDGNDSVH